MSTQVTNIEAMQYSWHPGKEWRDRFDVEQPDEWTPEWVGYCIIEAFKVDRKMPRIERPKDPGSAHPQIEYTQEEKDEWEKIPLVLGRTATLKEIAKMEIIFGWLGYVLAVRPNDAMVLRWWGLKRAVRVASDKAIAGKMGMDRVTFWRRRDRALDLICSKLTKDRAVVF